MRLIDSSSGEDVTSTKEGLLQMWSNGEWKYVCHDCQSDQECQFRMILACLEMGFAPGVFYESTKAWSTGSTYNSSNAFWENISCTSGDPVSLDNCSRDPSTSIATCAGTNAMSITCLGKR